MIYYKSAEEIELIRQSCLIVGQAHAEVAKHVEVGVMTSKLDAIAEEFIRDHGGVPAFKGYNGFPYSLCISVNSAVVHGFPSDKPIESGDIVSIDCGVEKNGFFGDSAYTYPVGDVSREVLKLLEVTKESLYKGIEKAVQGMRIGDIGNAVQSHAEEHGYSVVRELVGHGVGRHLHESPEVPNYGRKGTGTKLTKGLVIAIEPMINMGKKEVKQLADGWTIVTTDGMPSAHYEHTVAIGKGEADILSTFEGIEEVLTNKVV